MGPPKEGKLFWDRWLREYYQDRVPVAVDVQRVSVWSDLDCAGPPDVHGAPAAGDPPPQAEPKNGTGPRVDAERAARRLRGLDHVLLAYVGARRIPRGRARHGRRTPVPTGIRLACRAPAAARRPPRRASWATPTGRS